MNGQLIVTPRTCRKAVFLSPFSSQFAEFNQITPIPSEKWRPFLSHKWTRYRKYRHVIPFFTLNSGVCIYAHIWSSKVHLLTNPFFDIRLVVSPTDLAAWNSVRVPVSTLVHWMWCLTQNQPTVINVGLLVFACDL